MRESNSRPPAPKAGIIPLDQSPALEKSTMRGDRTRDQSIKSRTLYRTELARHQEKNLRGPGIEPGSTAWKAAMLTITPATLQKTKKISESKFRSWDLSVMSLTR